MRGAARPAVRRDCGRPGAGLAAILALACLALACLPEAFAARLAWERAAIADGQWWRLWTAHLVHFGLPHALADAVPVLAAGALLERRIGPARLLRWLAVAAPAVSLLLFGAMPGLAEYRGASGLAVMLAVAAAIASWPQAGRWRPALVAGVIAWAGAGAWQALGAGAGLSSLPPGVAVAWQAHLLGAACGVLAGLRATAISPSHT